jgi:hypothetical protein
VVHPDALVVRGRPDSFGPVVSLSECVHG